MHRSIGYIRLLTAARAAEFSAIYPNKCSSQPIIRCSSSSSSGGDNGNDGGNNENGGGDLTNAPPNKAIQSFGQCRHCSKPLKPLPTLTRESFIS
uniref:Uncharacterized protein n=2 Tax=Caenorhabditis japonica TaxID=281687 RepID=A0A8R1EUX4_CAEJA